MITAARSFALVEIRALVRGKFPFVWFLVLPAAFSVILGPSLANLDAHRETGRVVVGFAVMFSFMSVNYVGRALYREFHFNTWRRTALVAPNKAMYIIGKCCSVVAITLFQLVTFLVFSVTVLHLPLQRGVIAGSAQAILVFVFLTAVGVGLGVFMFTSLRRAEVFFSLTYLVLMVFASIGGALVPSGRLPGWAQAVGPATPHYWAMRGLDAVTTGSGSTRRVLESAAVLLGQAVLLFVLAARRLDYSKERFEV